MDSRDHDYLLSMLEELEGLLSLEDAVVLRGRRTIAAAGLAEAVGEEAGNPNFAKAWGDPEGDEEGIPGLVFVGNRSGLFGLGTGLIKAGLLDPVERRDGETVGHFLEPYVTGDEPLLVLRDEKVEFPVYREAGGLCGVLIVGFAILSFLAFVFGNLYTVWEILRTIVIGARYLIDVFRG